MLTPRQFALLRYIDGCVSRTASAPSFEEMRVHIGERSKSGVARMVAALEERGFIRRLRNRARAIEVLRRPRLNRTVRVAICTAFQGTAHAGFADSLAKLVAHSLRAAAVVAREPVQLELETFMEACGETAEGLRRLSAEATEWGADYMLCLDPAHAFPPDGLVRLLAHGVPAVGTSVPRERLPAGARQPADNGLAEAAPQAELAMLLLDMGAVDALALGDGGPLSSLRRRLAECGIRTLLDQGLSWEVQQAPASMRA